MNAHVIDLKLWLNIMRLFKYSSNTLHNVLCKSLDTLFLYQIRLKCFLVITYFYNNIRLRVRIPGLQDHRSQPLDPAVHCGIGGHCGRLLTSSWSDDVYCGFIQYIYIHKVHIRVYRHPDTAGLFKSVQL